MDAAINDFLQASTDSKLVGTNELNIIIESVLGRGSTGELAITAQCVNARCMTVTNMYARVQPF